MRAWVASVGLMMTVLGCTSTPSYDRAGAVDRIVAENDGRVSREQAECYVDRVIEELGSALLEPGAQPKAEQVPRLTSLRIDCIGVNNLGTTPPSVSTPPTVPQPGISQPLHVGDDPELDRLAAACQAGSGPACDQLFDTAPIGSDYENIALTCGGRTSEKRCADVYPDPTAPVTTP